MVPQESALLALESALLALEWEFLALEWAWQALGWAWQALEWVLPAQGLVSLALADLRRIGKSLADNWGGGRCSSCRTSCQGQQAS